MHEVSNHKHRHKDDNDNDNTSEKKLAFVSILNLIGFFIELIGGLLFGSVALISDAIHMLFDSLAYVMAYLATFVAKRYNYDNGSYGIHRVETLAAFVNGVLLIPMVGFILWKSYQRFLSPIDIGTTPTLFIAFGGLLINIFSVYILQGDNMSLNEKGAFYHLLGDAGGSIAVIFSTILIYLLNIRVIDPIFASIIAVFIAWSAVKVLIESGSIFMHKTSVEIEDVVSDINNINSVLEVQDIHIWHICSQIKVATTHIKADVQNMKESDQTVHRIHEILSSYGVDHATVEIICSECNDNTAHISDHNH